MWFIWGQYGSGDKKKTDEADFEMNYVKADLIGILFQIVTDYRLWEKP